MKCRRLTVLATSLVENSVELDDENMEACSPTVTRSTEETLKRSAPRKAKLPGRWRLLPRSCAARRSRTKACSRCSTRWSIICSSPVDIPPTPGFDFRTEEPVTRQASDEEALSVLAFKIMDDPFVGSLTFCRIYSGKLESGMGLLNSSRDRRERVGRSAADAL